MKMPGSETERFSLTTTFVPNQRQNMAAFMAVDATASGPNPPLEILQLPSTTAIQGPPQAQNLFESNTTVSTELNLLRGGGTDVLYGNLLTLPFGGGLLYVEPVYIQPRAETSGKYPTLRRVLVLYGEKVGFGPTLSNALEQVFGGTVATPPDQTPDQTANQPPGQVTPPESTSALTSALDRAQQAYDDSQKALSANPPDWKAYGDAQASLKKALDDLAKLKTGTSQTPAPSASPSASGSPCGRCDSQPGTERLNYPGAPRPHGRGAPVCLPRDAGIVFVEPTRGGAAR